MYKKLITACMAIAAFAAFVLPATASATNDPTLTDDGGHVAVGSKILATQVGNSFLRATSSDHKGSIQLTCSTGELTGTVLQNSGGTVEGEITFATFGGTGGQAAGEPHTECTGFSNSSVTPSVPMCVKSTPLMATHEFQVTGGKCGENKKVTFNIAPTGLSTCHYESTGALVGEVSTSPEDAVVKITPTSVNGFSKTAGSFLCPSSSHLDMTLTLETDTTKSVDPIYVS